MEPLLQSQISAQTPPEKRGTVIGILGLVGSGGWSLAPMAGSGISVRFSTNHVFLAYTLFLGLTAAVSLVLWRRVRATEGGRI